MMLRLLLCALLLAAGAANAGYVYKGDGNHQNWNPVSVKFSIPGGAAVDVCGMGDSITDNGADDLVDWEEEVEALGWQVWNGGEGGVSIERGRTVGADDGEEVTVSSIANGDPDGVCDAANRTWDGVTDAPCIPTSLSVCELYVYLYGANDSTVNFPRNWDTLRGPGYRTGLANMLQEAEDNSRPVLAVNSIPKYSQCSSHEAQQGPLTDAFNEVVAASTHPTLGKLDLNLAWHDTQERLGYDAIGTLYNDWSAFDQDCLEGCGPPGPDECDSEDACVDADCTHPERVTVSSVFNTTGARYMGRSIANALIALNGQIDVTETLSNPTGGGSGPPPFSSVYKMDYEGTGCVDGDTADTCTLVNASGDDSTSSTAPLEGLLSGSWNTMSTTNDASMTFDIPNVNTEGAIRVVDFIATKVTDDNDSSNIRNFSLYINNNVTAGCTLDNRWSTDLFRTGSNSIYTGFSTDTWDVGQTLKIRLKLELRAAGDICTTWWTPTGEYGESTDGGTQTVTGPAGVNNIIEVRFQDTWSGGVERESHIVIDDVRICDYDPGAGVQCN